MLCHFFQGWFSPGQIFVLDEYCARYGVRGCHRQLCYLSDMLDRAETGVMIDPTLLHYSFAFCASHVHGNRSVSFWEMCSLITQYAALSHSWVLWDKNTFFHIFDPSGIKTLVRYKPASLLAWLGLFFYIRPDGLGTITVDEKTRFEDIKIRLWNLLAYQITRFRYELDTISKLNDHGRIAPHLFSSFVPSLLISGFFFFFFADILFLLGDRKGRLRLRCPYLKG